MRSGCAQVDERLGRRNVDVDIRMTQKEIEGPARIADSVAGMGWSAVASIAYLVYPTTLLGFAVRNRLLNLYPVASVAPLPLLVLVFGMASSVVVLQEDLQIWKVAAFVLVILGLCVNQFGTRLYAGISGARI